MARVEQQLCDAAANDVETLDALCSYVLASGGKRLRPLVLLLAARFCGYRGSNHIPLACAVEYIHTATLLHDDVIDHAEVRRGNSSANVLWGNQSTILAGDYFFSKAFSLAVDAGELRVLQTLAHTCTCMSEAETLQVAKGGDPLVTEDEYFFIIRNKTASLIATAARIGGILGGATPACEEALGHYGMQVGTAFQIMDDVLDYSASERVFGKTIGKDLQEGSVTLPFIVTLQRSTPAEREFMTSVFRDRQLSREALPRILEVISRYEGCAYAVETARVCARQAIDALAQCSAGIEREHLVALAEYVVERSY